MANITEGVDWESGIYQFETTDAITGGPEGVDNLPHKQLGARTKYLKGLAEASKTEIEAARQGKTSLSEVIGNILESVGEISSTLSGLGSATSVQSAVTLDWLYRDRRIEFELFSAGYNLQNHPGVAITSGVIGDDSLDVADTSNVKIGEDYLIYNDAAVDMIRVTAIHSGTRLRLAANLTRNWGAGDKLSGSTLVANDGVGVHAKIGAQWISKAINLGENNTSRAVVIRRTLSAGEVKLYFRDAFTTAWTERAWSVRRSGGGTSGVPTGFADYEYVAPMKGDGYLRIVTVGEEIDIRHIVALGSGTGLIGYVNPLMRPNAPTISNPINGATNVIETPTITASGYVSPASNAFSTAQFQLSTSSTFATTLHDSGEKSAMTYSLPAGVLPVNTLIYVRARVNDVAGLVSDWATATSFTTKTSYAYVNTPTVTTPTNGQTEIPEQPTLQSSAFAVTGSTDTHASSQWQIRLASAAWTTVLHDSGASTTAKTSYTVPAGVLVGGQTQYVMRVRHTGTTLGASEWSSDIAFTTKQQFAQILGIVCTATGGGSGTWQRVDENFAAITTTAATFNNHPTYAGVVAQTIDSQAMMKVPKFYLKTGTVPSGAYAGKRYWMISDQPVSGFSAHPAFMNAGVAIDQFWVGKYQGTTDSSKLGSAAGLLPLVSIDFPTMQARATARNTGGVTGFALWNIYQLSAIQTLALIEMGGSDSQTLIGQGNVSSSAALAVDSATVAQATWRGIVGLWGNVWQMVDGLQTDASSKYMIWDKNGNKTYQTTTLTAPTIGTYPVTMATATGTSYDLSTAFAPETTNSAAASATFPDIFYSGASCVAYTGGSWSNGANAGLFYLSVSSAASTANTPLGGRLAKV